MRVILLLLLSMSSIFAIEKRVVYNSLESIPVYKLSHLRANALRKYDSIELNKYSKTISILSYQNALIYNIHLDIDNIIFDKMSIGDIKNFIVTYDLLRECSVKFNKLFFKKNGKLYIKYSLKDGQSFFEYIIDDDICSNKKDVKFINQKEIKDIDNDSVIDSIVKHMNQRIPIAVDRYTTIVSFVRDKKAIKVIKEIDLFSLDISKINLNTTKNNMYKIESNSLCTNKVYKKLFEDGFYFIYYYKSNIDSTTLFEYTIDKNSCISK